MRTYTFLIILRSRNNSRCGFVERKVEQRLHAAALSAAWEEPRCVCGFARRKAEKRLRLELGGASVGIRAFFITSFVVCYLRALIMTKPPGVWNPGISVLPVAETTALPSAADVARPCARSLLQPGLGESFGPFWVHTPVVQLQVIAPFWFFSTLQSLRGLLSVCA